MPGPTRNDLIAWLRSHPEEVQRVIDGPLQYDPYVSPETYRFAFQGGMTFEGRVYLFRGNLHHDGGIGSVWLNGVEGSVNRQANPASDIIQNRFRELSNDLLGTKFDVSGDDPPAMVTEIAEVAEAAEIAEAAEAAEVTEIVEVAAAMKSDSFPISNSDLAFATKSPLAKLAETAPKRHNVPPPGGVRPGRLVIVGSGIKSLSQMTMEAAAHIKAADKVFYAVADPLTEEFIERTAKSAYDLYMLYDDNKPRFQTYVQMAESMLNELRRGRYVVGVFYGHPGVFVNPSHRAIGIAREEGYRAEMLAAVSAEDNLFADIGVDPSRPGCQTIEATDMLLRNRPLLTDSHVVIFQVGSVGDLGFNFQGFKNQNFDVLVDRLMDDYGEDHAVVHYVAPQYAILEPLIERYQLSDLKKAHVAKRITGISTFYLPPRDMRPADVEIGNKMGPRVLSNVGYVGPYQPGMPYGDREGKAAEALSSHVIPKNYRPTRTTDAMYYAMHELALNPKAQETFRRQPDLYLNHQGGLSHQEKSAIKSAHSGRLRFIMKQTSESVADKFVQYEIRNPKVALAYADELKENQNSTNGQAAINQWLKDQGYPTTAEAVYQAFIRAQSHDLSFYQSRYHTFVDDKAGPVIVIKSGAVTVNGVKLVNPSYANSALTWSVDDGNASSGSLTFQMLTNDDGKPLPKNAYIGPQFYGLYWLKGVNKPSRSNIFGKVGINTPSGAKHPTESDPASFWFATYQGYKKDGTGHYVQAKTLVINADSSKPTAIYGTENIKNLEYADNTFSWSASDGNSTSASLYFYNNTAPTHENPTPGNQCFGKLWSKGDPVPATGNFFAQIGACKNPSSAAAYGSAAYQWKIIGINLGVGIATFLVSMGIIEAIKALVRYVRNKIAANRAALEEADQNAAQDVENAEAVQDQAAEVNSDAEAVEPGDVPAQAAEAAEAAEAVVEVDIVIAAAEQKPGN